jgi:3-deoxy-D-manno-octulosonate 8-phosphate phosphatase (KDO 8-P phosphatase)
MTSNKKIKLVVTDVDGVLTDSGYYYDNNGNILKKFNTRDFFALSVLKDKLKIPVMILTGASDNATLSRMNDSNLPVAYGITDKIGFMNKLLPVIGIKFTEVLYCGDHLIDLPVLKTVGVSYCPSDAIKPVLDSCLLKSRVKGGRGVIDDLLWQIMPDKYEKFT